VSLLDHDPFFEGALRWAWARAGGAPIGPIRFAAVDPSAKVIDAHESPPITAAVNDVGKFSNNVMAQHLLLTIDKEKNGAPANLARGSETVKRWMQSVVKDASGLVIENGSGLSRAERVSAQTLVALFRYMQSRPTFEAYLNSLPIAGVDGTLSYRFQNSSAQASAFLKTGGLNDVRSLAGYLRRSDGRFFYFVGIVNHPRANAGMVALERAVEWAYAQ
jgi:serine-type D-Ala-D-Ala carboxypeptidase/endopeptidase (penicillin-binding protein 4)